MSANSPASPPKPVPAQEEAPSRPLFPSVWLIAWIVFAVLLSVLMQTPEVNEAVLGVVMVPDHAVMNLITVGAIAITLVASTAWLWISGHSLTVKLAPLITLAFFIALFRSDGFTGEMWPKFVFRWSAVHDETLGAPQAAAVSPNAPAVDLTRVAVADFPQFLGPHRNAALDAVRLEPDWKVHPPKLLQRWKVGDGWGGFAVVNGYGVTLEQRGPLEVVTCYRLRTGELVWAHGQQARHTNPMGGLGPRSTPTVHAGRVYAQGATGWLYCLDGATGKPVWEKNLQQELGLTQADEEAMVMWGRAASPLVVDGLVVVPYGGRRGVTRSLVAFNKDTGAKVWEGGDRQISYSSPLLATLGGVPQILIVNENNVSSHDPATGKVLWEHDFPGNSSADASASQPHVLSDSLVFLSKGYGIGCRVIEIKQDAGVWNVEVVWEKNTLLNTKFTNVAIHEGYAYGLDDGILECVEVETGRKAWKRGRYEQGQVLRVGDLLLVQAEAGDLFLVECNPDRHVELGRLEALSSQTWNNPALAGNLLVLRNGREAAVYEVALEGDAPPADVGTRTGDEGDASN